MKTRMMMIMAMAAVIAMAGSAMATTFDFSNATPGAPWATATNWTAVPPGPLPTGLPDILGGDTHNVKPGFSPTLAGGQVQMNFTGTGLAALNISGGTTTLGGLFAYGNPVPNDTVVTHSSGTLHVGTVNGFNLGGFSPAPAASATLSTYNMNGGILQNDGFTFIGRDANRTGQFIQTAGSVTLGDGSGADYFTLGSSFGDDDKATTGLYEISGGDMTINQGGTGYLNIGTGFGAGSTEDGGAGTFKVVGSVAGGGPSAITWNGDPIIDGQGTNQGELAFTMDGFGVTPIDVNGTVTLNNSPLLTLDMSGLGAVGDIPLILNDGGDAIGSTFSVTGLAPGWTLTYSGNAVGGDGGSNDLVLVAPPIPEPAGLGLIGLALLAVRKKRS